MLKKQKKSIEPLQKRWCCTRIGTVELIEPLGKTRQMILTVLESVLKKT